MSRCKKCVLPENFPSVNMDSHGTCSFCRGEKKFGVLNQKIDIPALREDFENKIATIQKQNNRYDCLVPLSGGKDSAYLLWLLKEKYGLKCLAFHADKKFLPTLARKNVHNIVEKLNVDLITFKPDERSIQKIYIHGLKNPHADGCVKSICRACYLVLQSELLRQAISLKIPMIAMAFSPDQVEYNFYNISKDSIQKKRWFPDEIPVEEILNEEEQKIYWNPADYSDITNYPEFVFPFHVIDYDENEIREKIHELDLIKKKDSSILKTNCFLNWPMMKVDLEKNGYNPYAGSFAELVRQGKTSRKKWIVLDNVLQFLIKRKLFKRHEFRYVEKELNLVV